MVETDFSDPRSVIQYAPTSGAFATDRYLDDREGFIDRVIHAWWGVCGNTIPCEPESHRQVAGQLYLLYRRYRGKVAALSALGLCGQFMVALNRHRSMADADRLLRLASEGGIS